MKLKSPARLTVFSLILILIAVVIANAYWRSGFGLSLFRTEAAAIGSEEIATNHVPDGLSASDWEGIRAAYESGLGSGSSSRSASILGSIGQEAYFKPAAVGTTQVGDALGSSVAVSGNTVVVGAHSEDSHSTGVNSTPNESGFNSGAAYVFVRNAGVWTQQAYLKPAAFGTTQQNDQFGWSVAISGDTIIIGAPGEDSSTGGVNSTPNESAGQAGAAYVFTRSAGVWSQQAYLKPAAVGVSQAGDQFGYSVAVAGDTLVVGAFLEDSNTTGVNTTANEAAPDSGAAFVFTRSAGVWTQQAYLKPAAVGTTQGSDNFGSSVAVAGDTVVVGAIAEDSGTTGVNTIPNESAATSGAVYVFTRSASVWTQEAYIKPAAVGTTQAGDQFGWSVAVADDTLVVGANQEDSATTGVNSTADEGAANSGAAYVFLRNAGVWAQQAYLKPAAVGTTQAGDQFGYSVGIALDTAVVGARDEDSNTTGVNSTPDESASNAGAAYVFTRSIGAWTEQTYLKPAFFGELQAADAFGCAVAVAGDTVVVGANGEDSQTTSINSFPNESAVSSGAAYVIAGLGPASPTPTATETFTPSSTATNTFTPTSTATETFTPTATFTSTFTPTPTSTNTFTPTATSTNTFTPTSTATQTFTPTLTATNTSTNTATNTPTPTATPYISGTITYGNPASPPGKLISNATVDGTGSVNVSTTTGPPGPTAGQYTLTGFGSGSYTVCPSKTTGQNGIASGDAARVAQHVAGVSLIISDSQKVAADVTNNGGISSQDAAQIARFVAGLGPPIGLSGSWRFFVTPGPSFPVGASPTCRNYTDPIGSQTSQDFIGILVGEVTGNWAPGPLRPAAGPERGVAVQVPGIAVAADKEIIIPVSIEGAAGKGIISYEFDLSYDPSVIQPLGLPVDVAGTASRGLAVVTNAMKPGLLRVVVYGPMPINEDGVLLNLRFTAAGNPGSTSPLTWERIMFNEGEPGVAVTDGQVQVWARSE